MYDDVSYGEASAAAQPEVVSGLYFLFKDGELTYVGQSKDCRKRIEQHRGNGRPFDFATIMPIEPERRSLVEAAIIHKFAPSGNVAGKPKPPAPPKAVMPPAWSRAVAEARLEGLAGPRVKPFVPDPNDTRTISKAQARLVAQNHGVRGALIDEAIADGRLQFVETGRGSGPRGAPIRVGLYQAVLAFCQAEARAELDRLGLRYPPHRSEGA